MRFVDGEKAGADAINLKPFVGEVDAFELAVGGARQVAAPLRFLAGLRSKERDKNANGKLHLFILENNISGKDTRCEAYQVIGRRK